MVLEYVSRPDLFQFLMFVTKKRPQIAVPGLFFSNSRSGRCFEHILRLGVMEREQRDGANLQHLFLAIFNYKTGENWKIGVFCGGKWPHGQPHGHIYIYIYTGCFLGLGTREPKLGTREASCIQSSQLRLRGYLGKRGFPVKRGFLAQSLGRGQGLQKGHFQ